VGALFVLINLNSWLLWALMRWPPLSLPSLLIKTRLGRSVGKGAFTVVLISDLDQ
jgi:hypothetical protein